MRIIAIHGKKGVGKSTLTSVIINRLLVSYSVQTFALPLKVACSILFRTPLEFFEDAELKERVLPEWKRTPRDILQKVSDGVKSASTQEHFVELLLHELDNHEQMDTGVVIVNDVRYQCEYDALKERGAEFIHIMRDTGNTDSHISEQGLPIGDGDIVINNNQGLGYLIAVGTVIANCLNTESPLRT